MIEYFLSLPENRLHGKVLSKTYDLPIPKPDFLHGSVPKSFHDRAKIVTVMNEHGHVEDILYSFGQKCVSYNHATKTFIRYNYRGMANRGGPVERHIVAFLMRCGKTIKIEDLNQAWTGFDLAEGYDRKDSLADYGVKPGDVIVLCTDQTKKCVATESKWLVKDDSGTKYHINEWVKKIAGLNEKFVNGTRVCVIEGDPRTL